jgi:hypothetical protein
MPDLVLKNGFDAFKPLGGDFYYVSVSSNGLVNWYPYMVFETKCDLDISLYPFDTQTCNIVFKTWSYSRWEVNLTVASPKVGFYEFVPNSAWEVTSTDATYDGTKSATDVVFIINLRRKSMYYVLNIFAPIILLGILSPAVFVIPADSGEKMGYAVTIFLTFVVFLTIVSAQLPVNSDNVCNIAVYLIIKLLYAVIIIYITSFQLRLRHRKPDIKIGNYFLASVRTARRLRGCLDKDAGSVACVKTTSVNVIEVKTSDDTVNEINPTSDTSPSSDIEWADVSDAIDFYAFWTVLFSDMLITTIIFTYNASAS